MAVRDASHQLIGGSIVLPLTAGMYDAFSGGKLDALEIEAFHISTDLNVRRQNLLIDMWAFPQKANSLIHGVTIRSLIRHLAEFYDPYKQTGPLICCSTENYGLIKRLKQFEFRTRSFEKNTSAHIYEADLSNIYGYSEEIRPCYAKLRQTISSYHKCPEQK